MASNYSDHFQLPSAGKLYDENVYAPNTFDTHISHLQMQWLSNFIMKRFAKPPVHVDFACGTGRVLDALKDVTSNRYGLDPSEQMLSQARTVAPGAQLIRIGVAGSLPPVYVEGDLPVAVTMFRLLLNVDHAARVRAMQFARDTLDQASDGVLILNNHGNTHSLRQLAKLRRHRRGPWYNSMSHRDVSNLAAQVGLRIVNRVGFAILPVSAYRAPVIKGAARYVNRQLSGVEATRRISTDVVYVMEV